MPSEQCSESVSSMDSHSRDGSFEVIYDLMKQLKGQTNSLTGSLHAFSKRIDEIPLQEKFLEPRPNAKKWFEAHKTLIERPCELDTFLKVLFDEMAKEMRIDTKLRVLMLNKNEAHMFGLKENALYKWNELLANIPNVFY